jgi:hypothetical protein
VSIEKSIGRRRATVIVHLSKISAAAFSLVPREHPCRAIFVHVYKGIAAKRF